MGVASIYKIAEFSGRQYGCVAVNVCSISIHWLIRKLTSHGIEGDVRRWMENWLKGRQQRVYIDGCLSAWRYVTSGVPQGSVIGPILFLIYVNDLDLGVHSEILKFADDTKLYGVVTDGAEAKTLQSDLNLLTIYGLT